LPVIGHLGTGSPGSNAPLVAAFREGLRETGYVEGQNVAIESGTFSALAENATSTIPIVFEIGVDPVAAGFVASFNRPGGNATGMASLTMELMPKQSELVPDARMIAARKPKSSTTEHTSETCSEQAKAKKVQLHRSAISCTSGRRLVGLS
jgi:putative ABC transport system substrate-binding protein